MQLRIFSPLTSVITKASVTKAERLVGNPSKPPFAGEKCALMAQQDITFTLKLNMLCSWFVSHCQVSVALVSFYRQVGIVDTIVTIC